MDPNTAQQIANGNGAGPGGMRPKLQLGTRGQVSETTFKWPRDSHQYETETGEPVFEIEYDANGDPIEDEWHRIKLKLDANGKPIPKMSPQPDPASQKEIWLKYVRLSRGTRQLAINEATAAAFERRGKRVFDYEAFERSIMNRLILDSNIEGIPGPGWADLEDPTLGDYIVKLLRVWEQVGGKEAMDLGKGLPPRAPAL